MRERGMNISDQSNERDSTFKTEMSGCGSMLSLLQAVVASGYPCSTVKPSNAKVSCTKTSPPSVSMCAQ